MRGRVCSPQQPNTSDTHSLSLPRCCRLQMEVCLSTSLQTPSNMLRHHPKPGVQVVQDPAAAPGASPVEPAKYAATKRNQTAPTAVVSGCNVSTKM